MWKTSTCRFTTTRSLTASTLLLTDYIKWPGLQLRFINTQSQRDVYKRQRRSSSRRRAVWHHESDHPNVASAEDLLKLRREHWTIENKLHWIRDTVFQEDASCVRTGVMPQVMAALRNTAISVLRCTGHTKITDALQLFAAKPKLAVNLIK